MSKKVRGPVRSQRRPGSRAATQRPSAPRNSTSQLEAAEVIAEDVIEERPAEAAEELERVSKTVPTRPGTRTKPGSLLAVRAATEYVYVAQDMRRILVVAGALFATLLILWLLIVQLKIVPLPFY
jgi:hypothetical protein